MIKYISHISILEKFYIFVSTPTWNWKTLPYYKQLGATDLPQIDQYLNLWHISGDGRHISPFSLPREDGSFKINSLCQDVFKIKIKKPTSWKIQLKSTENLGKQQNLSFLLQKSGDRWSNLTTAHRCSELKTIHKKTCLKKNTIIYNSISL